MPTFAEAMRKADATGAPVVEGFAVEIKVGAGGGKAATTAGKLLEKRLPGYGWTAEDVSPGWIVFRPSAGNPLPPPPLGEAWETVRALASTPGVVSAEPQLLVRLPVTNGSDAQRAFRLWGKVSDARLAEIQKASDAGHRHWSLEKLGVCDATGQGGAWALWKAKRGNKPPGDGILVAHPDTGYTRHPRLLPHLQPQAAGAALYGRNFVERLNPDALDPMADTSLGNFPGHGTGTASVIAAGHDEADQPWGIAPGAKVLPLRVSSSVIHLSFQNVCDAFVEAMARKAHVISMSLGGPVGSGLLNALVRQALDQGIVVVSAAGNNAPTVVFPALIPGVLGCAASNAVGAPWRFSGLGGAVVVTAPGELVWHDWAHPSSAGQPAFGQINTSGTSFATANVAGLAALWLSYHGREALIAHCGNRPELLPFLFRLCLQKSADATPSFVRKGAGGFGAGIARADRLLQQALSAPADVDALRTKILAGQPDGIVSFPVSSWWTILTLPTLTADGPTFAATVADQEERSRRIEQFLTGEKGLVPAASGGMDDTDRAEIGALAATDLLVASAISKVAAGGSGCVSGGAVRRYLLGQDQLRRERAQKAWERERTARKGRKTSEPTPAEEAPQEALCSPALRAKLIQARDDAQKAWAGAHPELARGSSRLPSADEEQQKTAYAIAPPPARRLRAFAFDPSLATRSAGAAVNEITIPVVFERELEPGPVGDYLEVVDVDPASDCAYAPVDLNHPFLLAQDGLPRSEGNPQFHQQMVYAVAMKTISHFEEALGRPIFWSSLRPWDWRFGDDDRAFKQAGKAETGADLQDEGEKAKKDDSEQMIQRLRLYPHALRDQNAYYSPQKRAILFGYFPAGDADPGGEYPGGVVFTCLAHDIIAHETTHAILDGMHYYYIEPTNPDVFAFHEAFADVVALFQRFTYSELLHDQIARARGRLDAGTLMTRLALQFGQATGRHQALRDALGHVVRQARSQGAAGWRDLQEEGAVDDTGEPEVTIADAARDFDDEMRYQWKRFRADPTLLARVEEPHARGSFLVAAVFDAYLLIYEDRVADLKRIATGGTGVLPEGDLHPDLVHRMANEAAKSARHVLRMCIRAMDYVPPLDITFGEFLRALITADSDLVPDDDRRYRVAFIDSFRKWGIYPRDVRTLSEESLRWAPPEQDAFVLPEDLGSVQHALLSWLLGESRKAIFPALKEAERKLWWYLHSLRDDADIKGLLGQIDTGRTFQVANLRPARRIGPRGEFLTEMVVEVLQRQDALPIDPKEKRKESQRRSAAKKARLQGGEAEEASPLPFRGGVTLIIALENDRVRIRYAIYKRLDSAGRQARQRDFLLRAGTAQGSGAAEYSSQGLPAGWDRPGEAQDKWLRDRVRDCEAMRASSCFCRGQSKKKAGPVSEPFALLHRG